MSKIKGLFEVCWARSNWLHSKVIESSCGSLWIQAQMSYMWVTGWLQDGEVSRVSRAVQFAQRDWRISPDSSNLGTGPAVARKLPSLGTHFELVSKEPISNRANKGSKSPENWWVQKLFRRIWEKDADPGMAERENRGQESKHCCVGRSGTVTFCCYCRFCFSFQRPSCFRILAPLGQDWSLLLSLRYPLKVMS